MNQPKSEKPFADKPELVKSLLDEIIEETTLQMEAKAKASKQGGVFGVGALDTKEAWPVTSPCPSTFGAAPSPTTSPIVYYPVTYPCPATFGAAKAA